MQPQTVLRGRTDARWRSVLITGAAGTIGAALADRLGAEGCERVGLLDHFDHALFEARERLQTRHPQSAYSDLLCDVRNPARLTATVSAFAPDLVVHAAALKHVDGGERHVAECILTNLIAVRNAIEASVAAGARRFILISTDKAAAPVSVMGVAKRLAELHLDAAHAVHGARIDLRSVRFGNVYGSQGSVVPRFIQQIERGGPVEVTHPDMERYFISLQDAVEAILAVSYLKQPTGDRVGAYVLDMGEPVHIATLARKLIAERGSSAEVVFTRPREGEKLHEALWDECEIAAPQCPLSGATHVTSRAGVSGFSNADMADLEAAALTRDGAALTAHLFRALDRCLGREDALAG